MQLKQYQQATLNVLRDYLAALVEARAKAAQIAQLGLDVDYEWDREAWKKTRGVTYIPRRNGMDQPLPVVCFKIPTGGGKTFLAVKAIDLIQHVYRGAQTGLVLWVVPTTQIYRQTLQSLRDRAHPYRQALDLSSGGRTLILEKGTRFSPADLQANLMVLLLMLPSASRQNKETLRMFQDQGGFEAFFPPEDRPEEHADLKRRVSNLDVFAQEGLFGTLVKSSLGNTLRLLNPVIVLDEGHKAYSVIAQQTLLGFNPAFILELSATPVQGSNVLVSINGQDVLREGMIKLDLHVHNRASADWRDTVLAVWQHRNELERVAREYEMQSGDYIRPIALFQAERTGAKQRLPGLIHAEDVREYLIAKLNVLPTEIAVKSSERDEIENIDLLDRDCPIRYIITKHALQEGWDCPFAYIVTILTNPESTTGVTQLVGRVLRQPYARKTGLPDLDESHVYCFRAKTTALLDAIRGGLMQEGLGDLTGRIVPDVEMTPGGGIVDVPIRDEFQHYVGKVYLPCFVTPDERGGWREVRYEMDILSRVKWGEFDLSPVEQWELNPTQTQDSDVKMSLDEITIEPLRAVEAEDMQVDAAFIVRQLLDVVPNPWVASDYVAQTLAWLGKRFSEAEIRRDLGFVIQELKKLLAAERERLARQAFDALLDAGALQFYLISGHAGSAIPERIQARAVGRKLTRATGDPLARTLFDFYYENEFSSEPEKAVALYLDQQEHIIEWWCRNKALADYSLQGWRQHRVYPDFIAMRQATPPTVYVLETKGLHLKNNDDTNYKKALFELCNECSQPTPWDAVVQQFSDHKVNFQVVFEDEWERVLNAMLTAG